MTGRGFFYLGQMQRRKSRHPHERGHEKERRRHVEKRSVP